jgi:hypothetical protein
VVGDEAPPAGEPEVLPLAEPGVLGCAAELELELESLLFGEVALAPPEAEPDFDVSLELDEAPVDGDEGEVLELEEPGVDEVLLVSPRSHAASPKASATAAARMESFMCPPWLGYLKESSKLRARPKPLIA